jgi:hypothetical protein
MPAYRGLISSDWSECLSPNGPFDFMAYVYPQLESDLATIFKQYTGNQISLKVAMWRCQRSLPAPISIEQMDAYLDAHFAYYTGVPELIESCLAKNIIFMINTTGSRGYFQRAIAKKLLPSPTALSAHPEINFGNNNDTYAYFALQEITDKPVNTEKVAKQFQIPSQNIIVVGDSGGDGPHFKWAAEQNAYRVASMAKPSLKAYCREHKIEINRFFGLCYEADEPRRTADEMQVDFQDLLPLIMARL